MPRDVLTGGVERSRDRARRFGRDHSKPQKPGPVTVTLTEDHAAGVTILPSAHPTKVVAAAYKEDGTRGPDLQVTELPPGVGVTLALGAKGWAVTKTVDVRSGSEKAS